MTEDAVKAEAYALGLSKVGSKLTEAAKFSARASLIMHGLADAQGDLEKTAGGAANQYRKLSGSITNLGSSLGSTLMPTVQTALGMLGSGVSSISDLFDRNRPAIETFAGQLSSGLETASSALAHIMPEIRDIGSTLVGVFGDAASGVGSLLPSFGSAADAIKAARGTVNSGLQNVIGWVKGIPAYIDEAFGAGSVASILAFAAGFGSAIALAGPVLGTLVATFSSVPVLVGLAGASSIGARSSGPSASRSATSGTCSGSPN